MTIIDRIDPLRLFPWYLFALPATADAYRKSCIHFFKFMSAVFGLTLLVGLLDLLLPSARSHYTSNLTPLGLKFLSAAFLLVPSLVALVRVRRLPRLDVFALALVASVPVIGASVRAIDLALFDQPQPHMPIWTDIVGIVIWLVIFWRFVHRGWTLRAEQSTENQK